MQKYDSNSIPRTYNDDPAIGGVALRAHLVVLHTRVQIVPDHATGSLTKSELELGFGVGPQSIALAGGPQGRDLPGIVFRDFPFGVEEEAQEIVHSTCSGGVCGQSQYEPVGVWRVG